MTTLSNNKLRVGIVGYGNLGQYLVKAMLTEKKLIDKFEICFIWNRTSSTVLNDTKVSHLNLNDLNKA